MKSLLHKGIKQFLKDTYYPRSHYSKNYYGKIRVDDGVAQIVLNVLDTLEFRELNCVCLKYGITGVKMNLNEIAQCVPKTRNPDATVSRERVRQMIARAMRKMRHPVRMGRVFRAMDKNFIPFCFDPP